MKTRPFLTLVALLFIFSINIALSYDYLSVSNPRFGGWYQGTIETAKVSIHPRGLYMECGLYLTFSARGSGFTNADSLEVQLRFDLPEGSIVHDSWLWIGDSIIRGKIMDKWTASAIYQDIVGRRRDPSILLKNSNSNYELRVYPMLGNETRKVKITYLVPAQWDSKRVLAALPTNVLRTSRYTLPNLEVFAWLDSAWNNPKIVEFPDVGFIPSYDTTFGNFVGANLPAEAIQGSLNFSIDAPFHNGVFLSKFGVGTQGYYQLAFLPSQALEISASQKVTILFDYDETKNYSVSKSNVLQNVRSLLHANFTQRDSFNLFFSHLTIRQASDHWLAADSATIESTFQKYTVDSLSSYSNMPSLLASGINFIKNNGNDASLLLVANTDQLSSYVAANQLIDDLLAAMSPKLPITVADFQNTNYTYSWIGGRAYYGNEYFYTNLTRLTGANYLNIRSGQAFSAMLAEAFHSVGTFITSFDLHTKLANGFCYGRFGVDEGGQPVYLNRPIRQIGRYNGSFPFIIEASGVYDSAAFSQTFQVPDSIVASVDTLAEEMWAGSEIDMLERETQTNEVVSRIVDESISARVLSLYSAFLCLEPGRGGEVCYDCLDESGLVISVEQTAKADDRDSVFQAYPNPFNGRTTICVKFPASAVSATDASFKIYNTLGQVVRTFDAPQSGGKVDFKFVWDGRNEQGSQVASGIYFFMVASPRGNHALKLLLVQ